MAMQNPEYISERGCSWRDIAAMWLVAAFVLGLVGLSGSLFGYRSQHVVEAGPPVMTIVAEVHEGFKQHGDDKFYRVSAQVAVPVNAR
jgi:hypothetical protein